MKGLLIIRVLLSNNICKVPLFKVMNDISFPWANQLNPITRPFLQYHILLLILILPALNIHGQFFRLWLQPLLMSGNMQCFVTRQKLIKGLVACLCTINIACSNTHTGPTTVNPLHAQFFIGRINIHLHSMPWLKIDRTQIVEILPHVRQGPTYSTHYHGCWGPEDEEPRHQQPWYLLCWSGLIRSLHFRVKNDGRPESRVHEAHLGPTGPNWAPCWPHEPCYQGYI